MNYSDWFIIALVLVPALMWVATLVPAIQPWFLHSLVKWIGVEPPRELEAKLTARAYWRARLAAVGGFFPLVFLYGSLRLSGVATTTPLFCLCIAVSLVGYGAGTLTATLWFESRRPIPPIRLARPRSVTVGDYVAPVLRVIAWGTMLFSAAIVAIGEATTVPNVAVIYLPSLLTVIAGFICLIVFEVGSRAIVRRGQPVGSAEELVWDDALRSSALRDLLWTPVVLVFCGSISAFYLAHSLGGGEWFAVVARLGIIVLYAAFGIVDKACRERFTVRLWSDGRWRRTERPETIAGEASPT